MANNVSKTMTRVASATTVSAGTTEILDPVERSLSVVGMKWTLLIVRDLLDGPRRFTEINRSLRRANAKVITARLRKLEQAGIVSRKVYAEVPPRVEYTLSRRGYALRPVIDALRDWGLPALALRGTARAIGNRPRRTPRATGRKSRHP